MGNCSGQVGRLGRKRNGLGNRKGSRTDNRMKMRGETSAKWGEVWTQKGDHKTLKKTDEKMHM